LIEAVTLETITATAALLAARRERLTTVSQRLKRDLDAIKAEAMPELQAAITEAAEAFKRLELEIQTNPQFFTRPRTVVAHGLKFGMEKGKGTLEIANPDKTVALIKKHFPDQVDLLIDTKETPAKDAIAKLPAADLKRLGCELTGTGDRVVIRAVEGDTDKLVKHLVKVFVDKADAEGDAE
jgi:hypothetical protein